MTSPRTPHAPAVWPYCVPNEQSLHPTESVTMALLVTLDLACPQVLMNSARWSFNTTEKILELQSPRLIFKKKIFFAKWLWISFISYYCWWHMRLFHKVKASSSAVVSDTFTTLVFKQFPLIAVFFMFLGFFRWRGGENSVKPCSFLFLYHTAAYLALRLTKEKICFKIRTVFFLYVWWVAAVSSNCTACHVLSKYVTPHDWEPNPWFRKT